LDETVDDQINMVIAVTLEEFWPRTPLYLVWVVGLVMAWRRRRQHPRVSRVTLLALAGFLLYYLLGIFLGATLAAVARRREWTLESIEAVRRGVEVIDHCIETFLWILVLVAIFGERQQQPVSRTGAGGTASPPFK
jgi:hypothetical protein